MDTVEQGLALGVAAEEKGRLQKGALVQIRQLVVGGWKISEQKIAPTMLRSTCSSLSATGSVEPIHGRWEGWQSICFAY